eukprot:m.131491 g.131491  ORF g.131491 m.131491 type:complete len:439 (+) comp16820_c0_seq5:2477-3793(+)
MGCSWMWVTATVGVLAVLYAVQDKVAHQPLACPHVAADCHFSDSYETARALFRARAASAGAELVTLPLPADPTLSIDIAVLKPKNVREEHQTTPVLVHVSGTHGVEGHAGSAIQSAVLEKFAAGNMSWATATVVLVHALNPFGFHHGRRWNENNVDLNRNLLPDDVFPGVLSKLVTTGGELIKDYRNFKPLFQPPRPWIPVLDDIRFAFNAVYNIAVHGYDQMKSVVVTGQYAEGAGLFFGGLKVQDSHAMLTKFLKQRFASASRVVFIDVHTGLGPQGVDTLITDERQAALRFFDNTTLHGAGDGAWKSGYDFEIGGVDTDAGAGYELARGSTSNYPSVIGWKSALHVTQEFGTVPGPLVLRGLVIENSAWHHGTNQDEKVHGVSAARNAFYVRRREWRRRVAGRGLAVFGQAIRGLADPAIELPSPADDTSGGRFV